MKAWTLGSGSKGNAILLESDGTRVIVDNGFSPRALAQRLASVQIAPESISAIIVTHEHVDHSRGVPLVQKKWKWHVYASGGTLRAMRDVDTKLSTEVRTDLPTVIGALQFEFVRVPHDANAPIAMVATAQRTGFRTGVAHDLGAIPDALRVAFARLDLLLLESNHDEEMLRNGPYPAFLQQRITGGAGHLSNRKSAAFARELAGPQLRELVLLHLSEVNNTPKLAVEAARAALTGRSKLPVTAAPQQSAAGPFGAHAPAKSSQQLALPL